MTDTKYHLISGDETLCGIDLVEVEDVYETKDPDEATCVQCVRQHMLQEMHDMREQMGLLMMLVTEGFSHVMSPMGHGYLDVENQKAMTLDKYDLCQGQYYPGIDLMNTARMSTPNGQILSPHLDPADLRIEVVEEGTTFRVSIAHPWGGQKNVDEYGMSLKGAKEVPHSRWAEL